MRQDQLTRVRGTLIGATRLDINACQYRPSLVLESLRSSEHFIDLRIKSNFDRAVRTCRVSEWALVGNQEALDYQIKHPLFIDKLSKKDPASVLFSDDQASSRKTVFDIQRTQHIDEKQLRHMIDDLY